MSAASRAANFSSGLVLGQQDIVPLGRRSMSPQDIVPGVEVR